MKDDAEGGETDDWGIYFIIIEALSLGVAPGNQTGFEAFNKGKLPIDTGSLDIEDPLVLNDWLAGREVDEVPCVVAL